MKQLDRLRRRAGQIRDLDVQIEALGSLRLESIMRDRARVMSFLQHARAKREKKLLTTLQDEVDAGLRRRLKRTSTRLRRELPKPAQQQTAENRFLAAALEKFSAVVNRYAVLTEGNLHNFRMDCKRVRYLAEMASESPKVAAVVVQLKRIQDAIGVWHDWMTLTATAGRALSGSGQVPLLSALRASARSKYLEALRVTGDAKHVLLEMFEPQHNLRKPVLNSGSEAKALAAGAATA